MTKEQALAMLKAKRECIELDTKGNAELCDRNCGECKLNYEQGNMGEQKEALDMAIKALEQQPSDDCVSRAEAIKAITDTESYNETLAEAKMRIAELPPVTPTHGTCKDCTNYVVGALDEEICIRGHELIHKDFYCADYKKRGGENE